MSTFKTSKIKVIYNIDQERYDEIVKCAKMERGKCGSNQDYTFLHKRGLELLKRNVKRNYEAKCLRDIRVSFNDNTEKQVFLNNFLFENENFAEKIKQYNITYNQIEDLILRIKKIKATFKNTGIDEIEINDIPGLDFLTNHHNLNNKELYLTKIAEIYALHKDLIMDDNTFKKPYTKNNK